MRLFSGILLALACLSFGGASAQEIPRIKARILSFDGKMLTVTSGTAGQNLSIGLMPSTRLMYETKADDTASSRAIIWAPHSAEAAAGGGGRSASSARYLERYRRRFLSAAIRSRSKDSHRPGDEKRSCHSPDDHRLSRQRGQRRSHLHGPCARTGGCKGELTFALPAKVPVVAIMPGDKSILAPGKVAAIS